MSHPRFVFVLAAVSIAGGLTAMVGWIIFGPESVDKALSSIQSLAATIAIGVGGYWTYTTFIRERGQFVRIEIEAFEVDEIDIEPDGAILHTRVRLRNVGKTKFSGVYAQLQMRQIFPVSDEVRKFVRSDINIVKSDEQQADWACIAEREWNWGPDDFDIEPSEFDTLHADFGIKSDVSIVEFYFFLRNPQKPGRVGWTETLNYRLKKGHYIMGEKNTATGRHSEERQQKPQQPRQPQQKPPPAEERPKSG